MPQPLIIAKDGQPLRFTEQSRAHAMLPLEAQSWAALSEPMLLATRICDLRLSLKRSWLQRPIAEFLSQLAFRGVQVRPHFWLADEWMTPLDSIGMGIPFYLMHPRLMRLERRRCGVVEGGSLKSALQLLRHEMGHVVCNAYQLHRRKEWRQLFGSPSKPYPLSYKPNQLSQNYVLHLADHYAQAHPDEDWAESFAVWLSGPGVWRRQYHNSPALRKLEYINRLMPTLASEAPRLPSRRQLNAQPSLKQTLGQFYAARRAHLGRIRLGYHSL